MSACEYEVVVIGAGIHGVGVAQAAAALGYRTLILEKDEPAAGTSSRSSKLIHGGLRYLESGRLRLVRESLRERELLWRNAPGLVRRVRFLIPVYKDSTRRPWQVRSGLSLYALVGGLARSARFRALPKAEWRTLGGLRQAGLRAVYAYCDGQTDDARLTRAVLASALRLGAETQYPAIFLGAERVEQGYSVRYRHHAVEQLCSTRVLVNASGPWVNAVQERIQPPAPALPVDLVQGTHLHLDRPVCDCVFYVEAPRDRRPVFVMPWRGGTLVGTTETPYRGEPEAVTPLAEELTYLQETLRAYFPGYEGRGVGSMAGLRVLLQGRDTFQGRSRETVLLPDRPSFPQLVAIYGGKLTTYRATAARVMGMIAKTLPPPRRKGETSGLSLECAEPEEHDLTA